MNLSVALADGLAACENSGAPKNSALINSVLYDILDETVGKIVINFHQ
jgi:hypothetical protein